MNSLGDLYKKYKHNDVNKIDSIYEKYIKRKRESLVDSILAATAISSIFSNQGIDYEALTPQMKEAFNLSFPNKNIEDLELLDSEQLSGIISNWKGKLFEIHVRDKLNSGELVGDIQLETGQYAEIAGDLNQPGWDLQIFNSDGTIADALQLKATNSLSYINEAFEKYPDIDIISTSEISRMNNDLINSDISLEELQTNLTEPIKPLFDSFGEDVLDSILPGLPFLIITLGEGRKAFVDKQTSDAMISNIVNRSVKTGISLGIGSIVGWLTGTWWIGAAASLVSRIAMSSSSDEISKLESEKLALKISNEREKLLEYSTIYLN
ncbi:hypothetical protein FJ651_14080 [Paucihalobacter ruber]|uniref:Uncharacterized protein n=1 Tax=Paucihalobacter ruber TaxID=2567861 RepID=A0A506PEL6_9FLAO|nr:hypothetical protein [Paucihalobacter ruber]TPV31938.1 hypothetical protein FJ651_14080 [Paucihalobacter ruber]